MINVDLYHVVEGIEAAKQSDEDTIQVWNKDAVMKGVSDDEMDERNIERGDYRELVCTITRTPTQITLSFHEQSVEEEFCLDPVGLHALDPQQATQPHELGEALNIATLQMNYAYDIRRWDFSKVNGASIAHGGYVTSYEFEFEALI